MNYTLRQLQIFLEVARHESVTKAAEALHMTQPAVSIQLRNLQLQFEIPLTEIIGKKLFLTEFGKRIALHAKSVLAEAEAIDYQTRAFQGLLAGRISISSASTGKYVIPYFLSGFLQEHPEIDLVLDVTNKQKVVNSLIENQTDFALLSMPPEPLDISEELLLENKLYLVGNKPVFDPDAPLIFREPGSATRQSMDAYFGDSSSRKSIELTSNEAVKQAVIAGMGYSILPIIGIKNELQNGSLYLIPQPDLPITTTWRLIWLRHKKLSPVAAAFLEYVRTHKAEIVAACFSWY